MITTLVEGINKSFIFQPDSAGLQDRGISQGLGSYWESICQLPCFPRLFVRVFILMENLVFIFYFSVCYKAHMKKRCHRCHSAHLMHGSNHTNPWFCRPPLFVRINYILGLMGKQHPVELMIIESTPFAYTFIQPFPSLVY